ncbi:MAG: glycosyltransferase family 4 protein, partial [Phototrophicaceae bacterium]
MVENDGRIRVLRVIARLNIGGPAKHVALLTKRLDPTFYDTTLVCGKISTDEGDMSYYAEQMGVDPIIIDGLRRNISLLDDLVVLWRMYQLMRQVRPHIVHTHTAKAGFIGRFAAWLAGVPVIVHTFHGHVFTGYFSPTKVRVFLILERMVARISDAILALTNSLRKELSETYRITAKNRITVLPLGLDLQPFTRVERMKGGIRQQYQLDSTTPLVGIVGRLAPVKNHALFLQAAQIILKQRPNVKFLIVGDGELRVASQDLARELGIQEAIIFSGWMKDVRGVFADLNVKVLSSHNEGTSVSVIEALATSCPVVSTDVGGMRDLLEGGKLGRLVPPNDAPALAQAILDILDNPPDPTEARQRMLDQYSIERLLKDMDSLYRGLLARKNIHG